jgi:hypothetical protein
MIDAIKNMIRAMLPDFLHNWLWARWVEITLWVLRKRIIHLLKSNERPFPEAECRMAIAWLKRNPVAMLACDFAPGEVPDGVDVCMDSSAGLKYVLFEGKRLYFIRGRSDAAVKRAYLNLLREQVPASPHCYLDAGCDVAAGDVVVDVGAAEGFFALSVIDRASKIYLVECEPSWIEALRLTFAPYGDKVEIIEKFVSDKSDGDKRMTLDDLLKGRQVNFIKADIEGVELDMLRGSEQTLRDSSNVKLSVCTYHNQRDADDIRTFLVSRGYETHFSSNFIILHCDPHLCAPWLRYGVLRAIKQAR